LLIVLKNYFLFYVLRDYSKAIDMLKRKIFWMFLLVLICFDIVLHFSGCVLQIKIVPYRKYFHQRINFRIKIQKKNFNTFDITFEFEY